MSTSSVGFTPTDANYSAADGSQDHVDSSYGGTCAPQAEAVEDGVDSGSGQSGWAFGIELGVTLVAPFLSGGGGSAGINIEYSSDNGLAIYGYGPSSTVNSEGISVGAGISVNVAQGNGSWSGPFDTWGGNLGPAAGSHFESAPGSSAAGEGYSGYSAGLGVGAPVGAAYSQTNYTTIVGE